MPAPSSTLALALDKLSSRELDALYAAMTDPRRDERLPPRERLAAWACRQRHQRFLARVMELPVVQIGQIYLRIVRGENFETIMSELPPQAEPPSNDGSNSEQSARALHSRTPNHV